MQKEGVVVERDEMVKGYEFAKDQYVLFSPRRSRRWRKLERTRGDLEFVPIESIDRVYFDKTYYLAPDKGAAKPTPCSPRRSGRPGAAASAAGRGGKGYLVILRRSATCSPWQQLHYAADVRRATEVDGAEAGVKPAELKLAQQLNRSADGEKFDADVLQGRAARAHRSGHPEKSRARKSRFRSRPAR